MNMVAAVPPPTTVALVACLLANLFNPSLARDAFSYGFAQAEVTASAMLADLVGYDRMRAAGIFTYGGAGTVLYGIRTAIAKLIPEVSRRGIREDLKIFAPQTSHYCKSIVASWLGVGTDNIVEVETDEAGSMKSEDLEKKLHSELAAGKKIAAIIAELGTTYDFGLDDLEAIVSVRDRVSKDFSLARKPHVHADAVIGWPFCVFHDYDFQQNRLGFSQRTREALLAITAKTQHLCQADSVGLDFHKLGYTPFVSSVFLVKDSADLDALGRGEFRFADMYGSYGDYQPDAFTLECTRSAAGPLSALSNCLLLGKDGFRIILGHCTEMAIAFKEQLQSLECCRILNLQNPGPAVTFQFYPSWLDPSETHHEGQVALESESRVSLINRFNRDMYDAVAESALSGRSAAISYTSSWRHTRTADGKPLSISALKCFMISPYTSAVEIAETVDALATAYRVVDSQYAR